MRRWARRAMAVASTGDGRAAARTQRPVRPGAPCSRQPLDGLSRGFCAAWTHESAGSCHRHADIQESRRGPWSCCPCSDLIEAPAVLGRTNRCRTKHLRATARPQERAVFVDRAVVPLPVRQAIVAACTTGIGDLLGGWTNGGRALPICELHRALPRRLPAHTTPSPARSPNCSTRDDERSPPARTSGTEEPDAEERVAGHRMLIWRSKWPGPGGPGEQVARAWRAWRI